MLIIRQYSFEEWSQTVVTARVNVLMRIYLSELFRVIECVAFTWKYSSSSYNIGQLLNWVLSIFELSVFIDCQAVIIQYKLP
jgi:hypothetical protein